MDASIPLWALPVGAVGRVTALENPEPLRRRLLDLGLTPGTAVTCVGRAPGGDPSAYDVCRAVVAIRRKDAALIRVHPGKEATYGTD